MLWEEEERMRNASVRIRACGIRKQTSAGQRLFPAGQVRRCTWLYSRYHSNVGGVYKMRCNAG